MICIYVPSPFFSSGSGSKPDQMDRLCANKCISWCTEQVYNFENIDAVTVVQCRCEMEVIVTMNIIFNVNIYR